MNSGYAITVVSSTSSDGSTQDGRFYVLENEVSPFFYLSHDSRIQLSLIRS